ncbi:hypothetical protein CDEST_06559 [Colletotrichum destructivum]|uniref:Uncharacterized protein n=1 Tax=Colletotrichum destructivum TaxID=34406 RepID=A0AAX4IE28_9PEZI|nr:hypothetical protein CDEST_06559 [Colletotrichum destructivum]
MSLGETTKAVFPYFFGTLTAKLIRYLQRHLFSTRARQEPNPSAPAVNPCPQAGLSNPQIFSPDLRDSMGADLTVLTTHLPVVASLRWVANLQHSRHPLSWHATVVLFVFDSATVAPSWMTRKGGQAAVCFLMRLQRLKTFERVGTIRSPRSASHTTRLQYSKVGVAKV